MEFIRQSLAYACIAILSPLALYIIVRIGSAAYFASKEVHEQNLERNLLRFREDFTTSTKE